MGCGIPSIFSHGKFETGGEVKLCQTCLKVLAWRISFLPIFQDTGGSSSSSRGGGRFSTVKAREERWLMMMVPVHLVGWLVSRSRCWGGGRERKEEELLLQLEIAAHSRSYKVRLREGT